MVALILAPGALGAKHVQNAAQVHDRGGSLCSFEADCRRGWEPLWSSLLWRCLRLWRRLQAGSQPRRELDKKFPALLYRRRRRILPSRVIFDATGNLYSTTELGGTYGSGVVFKLTHNSDGTWTESILYAFKGSADGSVPDDPLSSTRRVPSIAQSRTRALTDGVGCSS